MLQRAEKNFILATSTDEMEQHEKETEELDSALREKLNELIAIAPDEEKSELETFQTMVYAPWLTNNQQ